MKITHDNIFNMNAEIIIVGAGAAGLLCGLELAKAGKKVIILEARSRIGGRVMTIDEGDFGYPAEGGAEWVHGEAPITKMLAKEAGLTLIPEKGEIWSVRNGELCLHESFILNNDSLKEKLEALKEDVSVADFLEQNFKEEKDLDFKNSILKMVEGYDAADPKEISTFELRAEWMSKSSMTRIANDHRIKEGYGTLFNFLEKECKDKGVEIYFDKQVKKIEKEVSNIQSMPHATSMSVHVASGEVFKSEKVVITVPLPILKEIDFSPEIKTKLEAASKIGFGDAIKVIMKFKTRWWDTAIEKDLRNMSFMLCNEEFLTWWTQYPDINTVLTGWMAGPKASKHKDASSERLLEMALVSLSNVFKIDKDFLAKEIIHSKVINWPADPFSKGAYSYTRVETKDAYDELAEPIDDTIFFAGEALFSGQASATVEGAFGSGLETA